MRRSPALAIGWQIWARGRAGLGAALILFPVGGLLVSGLRGSESWASFTHPIAYALTASVLLLTLCSFHFTEGSKKGGFGSFPARLFTLPMKTVSLVGWPMLYGAAAIVTSYLLCARLFLIGAGDDPPLLWPSLYLIFGLTQFQMIVWSLPESRYLKLFCLSVAAAVITIGWMFFVPTIVAGALSELGYTGRPEVFIRRFLVGLALTGPAAYGVSLWRVSRQRHGAAIGWGGLSRRWERLARWMDRGRAPFRSIDHAIVWQEWRRTGLVLPGVVFMVLGLTCLPALLSEPLSGRATMGILNWLLLGPFLFALVIGRGFGKPDFWRPSLKMAPFNTILPVMPGQWVAAKLTVALWSVALTWALVVYFGFQWLAYAGDFHGPKAWLDRIRFYYSPVERWTLLLLGFPVVVIVTWRLLIAGLAEGLSGSKWKYYVLNGLVGGGLIAAFIFTIWTADHEGNGVKLYQLWPLVEWLPLFLTLAVVAKLIAAGAAWRSALKSGMITERWASGYFVCWLCATTILALFFFILCRNTPWLRNTLMLAAMVMVPLAGPARAMHAIAWNRSHP